MSILLKIYFIKNTVFAQLLFRVVFRLQYLLNFYSKLCSDYSICSTFIQSCVPTTVFAQLLFSLCSDYSICSTFIQSLKNTTVFMQLLFGVKRILPYLCNSYSELEEYYSARLRFYLSRIYFLRLCLFFFVLYIPTRNLYAKYFVRVRHNSF